LKEIITSMVRSLFVACYADAWDNGDIPRALPHAGPQQDWFDHAPESDCSALPALKLALIYEDINCCCLLRLYNHFAYTEGPHLKDPTKKDFGYCLVMQALGSGVAWGDNHPGAETLRVPHIEAWIGIDKRSKKFYMETSGL
jgi:hypothetical protein